MEVGGGEEGGDEEEDVQGPAKPIAGMCGPWVGLQVPGSWCDICATRVHRQVAPGVVTQSSGGFWTVEAISCPAMP